MPKVMLRKGTAGQLVFYVAKKNLEDEVVSVEFNEPDKWGGEMLLKDGSKYYVDPLNGPPRLPLTVRAQRLGGGDND
ncbi:MAG TPA: putative nitrogen fixation protein NifT [Pirellulales bacterium]|nr:putative nitrogen fixation protein NifT [Pirellulales bacterium]